MDYYEKYKSVADDKTKLLISRRDELKRIIEVAGKNLAREQETVLSLEGRLEKLKSLSSESLTSDAGSFEKFKASQRKLTVELGTSKDACRTLKDEIIPKKTAEFNAVRKQIHEKLDVLLQESKQVIDMRIRDLIDEIGAERDSFYATFNRIYQEADCGSIAFSSNKEILKAYQAFRVSRKILFKQNIA